MRQSEEGVESYMNRREWPLASCPALPWPRLPQRQRAHLRRER